MPGKFNDNDQTKLYRSSTSDDQPTFRRPYPQQQPQPQQQQYQNRPQNGYAYPPQQNYQQGGYPQQQNTAPPLQNYYAPPQYQQPQYIPPSDQRRSSDSSDNSKGSTGIIVLLVITLLLILAVVGTGIYMYMNNNSSGGSKKNSSDTGNSGVVIDPQDNDEDDTDASDDTPQVAVPELRGSDYRNAETELLQADLRCETEYEFSDTISENTVISQSIPAGTEVDEGTVIKIIVSQGKAQSEKVIVPNVTGLSYEAAKIELANLKLNVTVDYTPNDKVAKDFVISQDTEPGTEVYSGASIKLTVSQGKDTQPKTEPDNIGKKYGIVNTEETDLNVRKGPSTDSDKIGSLPKGSKIEIIGSEGKWYKIVYNGSYGYVSKDYVKLASDN